MFKKLFKSNKNNKSKNLYNTYTGNNSILSTNNPFLSTRQNNLNLLTEQNNSNLSSTERNNSNALNNLHRIYRNNINENIIYQNNPILPVKKNRNNHTNGIISKSSEELSVNQNKKVTKSRFFPQMPKYISSLYKKQNQLNIKPFKNLKERDNAEFYNSKKNSNIKNKYKSKTPILNMALGRKSKRMINYMKEQNMFNQRIINRYISEFKNKGLNINDMLLYIYSNNNHRGKYNSNRNLTYNQKKIVHDFMQYYKKITKPKTKSRLNVIRL